MLSIAQALSAIKPALEPTARQAHPLVSIRTGVMRAFNGQIAAHADIDYEGEPFAVNAERLLKVYMIGSKIKLDENDVTVTTKRTKYKSPRLDPAHVFEPDFEETEVTLSKEALAGISMAANFASNNAIHPWACGVSLRGNRAYATNNIAAVAVDCPCPIDGTLPFWAVDAIRHSRDTLPRVGITPTRSAVVLEYTNGVKFRCISFAQEPPAVMFEWLNALEPVDIEATEYKNQLDEVLKVEGATIGINDREMYSVNDKTSDEAHCEIEQPGIGPGFLVGIETMKIILGNATHFGAENLPDRLLFSRGTFPEFVGMSSCIRS